MDCQAGMTDTCWHIGCQWPSALVTIKERGLTFEKVIQTVVDTNNRITSPNPAAQSTLNLSVKPSNAR